jgi:1-acyl-sn-glycerol-3-phosphate acyltransferase
VKALYAFGYTLIKTLLKVFFRFRAYGLDNVPRGKAIIAANHQSYVDPPVVGSGIREEIWYLAREDVFNLALFRWLCVKVNSIMIRKRRADRSALAKVLEKLAQGKKVLVFPEGTRSCDGELQAPERGIGLLAHRSGAPVVPAYVSGTFQVLPRGEAMIHLHPISVSFGPPLLFDERTLKDGARRAYEAFSEKVMDAIARLKASRERHAVRKPSSHSSSRRA